MRQRLGRWRRRIGEARQFARAGTVVCAAWLGAASLCWARAPEPMLRLPLEAMDFQPLPASVLNAGVAAMTLHYVDSTHLLVTFSRRRLMPRLADAQPNDFDRNVDALLLEMPSGKILARTSWRLRDAEHYLWPLGHGQFLLRVRNRLTTIAPLDGLKNGEAFREHAFVDSTRAIGAVLVSPSGDLLTLETLDRSPAEQKASPGTRAYAAAQAAAAGDRAADDAASADPVQINFFRLAKEKDGGGGVATERAGAVVARTMVLLPMDGAGLLTMLDQGRGHWAFDFHRHDGKVDELAPFDSSCRPTPLLVSRSEFIAFGCRGGQDRRSIGGFNLRGEQMWEQLFTESYTRPELSLPESGGRFALGRMVTAVPVDGSMALGASEVSAEQVAVYQTESGRVLLNLSLTPVLLAGGNFAMAPDGSALAVINNGAVEVYALPEPTGKERKAMEVAQLLEPERSVGPVRLDGLRAPQPAGTAVAATPVKEKGRARAADAVADAGAAAAAGSPAAPAAGGAAAAPATAAAVAPIETPPPVAAQANAPATVVNGDPQMGGETPRRRPTLYGPGEKGGPEEKGDVPGNPGAEGKASK